jgi:hypothetical protein
VATRSASITLGELFEHFKGTRQHRSKFYLRDIKWASDRFTTLHGCLVSDITRTNLATILGALPDSSRNNMLFKEFLAMFIYLWVLLTLFVINQSVVLAREAHSYQAHFFCIH